MGTIHPFAAHDARINRVCHSALPNHYHVAEFIAQTLRDHDGSVLVARMLCEHLTRYEYTREASEERVQAFAPMVGNDALRMRVCLHMSQNDGRNVDAADAYEAALANCAENYWYMESENKVWSSRRKLAIKNGKFTTAFFASILHTAFAMLSDTPIELVETAAV